jgi:hypothetical protein
MSATRASSQLRYGTSARLESRKGDNNDDESSSDTSESVITYLEYNAEQLAAYNQSWTEYYEKHPNAWADIEEGDSTRTDNFMLR